MIICKHDGPCEVEGWRKRVCCFELRDSLPGEPLNWECPDWSERLVEASLLRSPDLLARAVGVQGHQDVLVLKQVARIDLYLRTENSLHLLEVKKPTEHTQWRGAADQIARQWAQASHWLRRGNEPVYLWGVCPVRWSRRRGTPKIPRNLSTELAAITASRLEGNAAAALGLLFYGNFRSPSGSFFVLWRADETPPTVALSST